MAKKKRTTRRKRTTTARTTAPAKRRRRSGARKSTRGKKRRKGGAVMQAGMGKPLNIAALVAGAAAALYYKDDAKAVKMIKDPKTRYLVMAAIGLSPALAARIPMLAKFTSKIPEPLKFAMIGAGVGASVAAVPLVFPKLLPQGPRKASFNASVKSASNGAVKSTTLGLTSSAKLEELKQFIQRVDPSASRASARMAGRGTTLTGRMPRHVLTGRGTTLTGDTSYQHSWMT